MNNLSLDWPQGASSLLSQARCQCASDGELVRLILAGTHHLDSWLIENRVLPALQEKQLMTLRLHVNLPDHGERSASLVPLPESRVLMIVVTRDGLIRNQVAHLTEPVSQDELISIRNYVNQNFSGWSLIDIRHELGHRLLAERATYDSLLRKLNLLYDQGLLEVGFMPRVYMEGTSNLVGLDLHLTKEKLRDLFRALEEKKKLIELLDQFLSRSEGEVQVQVGLEDAHPSMRELSLIGITVELPGGLSARMAVLGPMRMNYSRVMAAVSQVGQALKSLPQ